MAAGDKKFIANLADVTSAVSDKVEDEQVLVNVPAGAVFTDTTYVSSDFSHDSLSGINANQHIDWSISSGSNIHVDNYSTVQIENVLTSTSTVTALSSNMGKTLKGITDATNAAVALNTAKATNVTTNLSTSTSATTNTVNSSDGTNAVLPAATTTVAGVMTGADKLKLNGTAPLASPALTGTPTVPTATLGTNTTQAASTAFVLANASVSTSGVLAATAGASANAVGTYMLCSEHGTNRTSRQLGTTVAGSVLRPASLSGGVVSVTTVQIYDDNWRQPGSDDHAVLSGTWRIMGAYPDDSSVCDYPLALWLRIS